MASQSRSVARVKYRGVNVNAGDAIEATRLRSAVLRDLYFSRMDAQFLTCQKEAQTVSGVEPREGHVLFQHIDLVAKTISEDTTAPVRLHTTDEDIEVGYC